MFNQEVKEPLFIIALHLQACVFFSAYPLGSCFHLLKHFSKITNSYESFGIFFKLNVAPKAIWFKKYLTVNDEHAQTLMSALHCDPYNPRQTMIQPDFYVPDLNCRKQFTSVNCSYDLIQHHCLSQINKNLQRSQN